MKKLTRRELFKRTGQAGIGGAALVVGLSPALKTVLAGGRFGKSYPGLYPEWTPEVHLPSNVRSFGGTSPEDFRLWQKMVLEEVREATLFPNLSGDLSA